MKHLKHGVTVRIGNMCFQASVFCMIIEADKVEYTLGTVSIAWIH